jgi:hypothetical protein
MASSAKERPHRPESARAKYNGPSGGLVEREARMRSLASQLLFTVERTGKRFKLMRTIDVSEPVRCDALTLGEAEDFLRTGCAAGEARTVG